MPSFKAVASNLCAVSHVWSCVQTLKSEALRLSTTIKWSKSHLKLDRFAFYRSKQITDSLRSSSEGGGCKFLQPTPIGHTWKHITHHAAPTQVAITTTMKMGSPKMPVPVASVKIIAKEIVILAPCQKNAMSKKMNASSSKEASWHVKITHLANQWYHQWRWR